MFFVLDSFRLSLKITQVRDIYEASEDSLLFLASDRLSAFDVVMKTGVPGKVRRPDDASGTIERRFNGGVAEA